MSADPYNKFMTELSSAMAALNAEAPSRERSLIQTKLEEAMMWADKARSLTIRNRTRSPA